MAKQFAVLGLGSFGYSVAVTLEELGCEVVAVDHSEEKVQQIIGIVGKIADIDRLLVHQIAGVFCKEARVPTGFEINVIGNIELCGK